MARTEGGMTMTDTEAKALALVNEICGSSWLPHEIERIANFKALCHYIEATEARHAAELREQAERFSEALIEEWGEEYCLEHRRFAPFILPKPDPLLEAEKLISTLRADEREGYAVAGQAAETILNLVAALRAHQKDTNA